MTWRPRQFRLGAMRDRVTIQRPVQTVSDAGDVIYSFVNLYQNEPAKFESVSGGETLRGREVEAGINAVFTVHYRSNYAPEQRLTHNGITYGIVYVKPIEGGRRYCEIWCRS